MAASSRKADSTAFDYRKLLRDAVAYDRQALAAIFRYTVNGQLMGEGADTNCEILHLLLKHWGDSRFASVLARQPQRARRKIIAEIEYDWSYPGWKPTEFPKTYRLAPHEKIPISHREYLHHEPSNQSLEPTAGRCEVHV